MPVILIATLDTKGREIGFVRDILREAGVSTIIIDAGSLGPPAIEPDIDRERVFFRVGTTSAELKAAGDRGQAVAAAAKGVTGVVLDLLAQQQVDGVLAIGGSAGTTIGTAAMRALPFGLPKIMVSTLASGQTRPYLAGSDIILMPSVADVAGLNRITKTVLTNAAHAMVGMVRKDRADLVIDDDWPVVAATMFGVTTPCVERARRGLEALGCEVLVFHATGVGGQAMEGLIRDGQILGVLDLTTTEWADEHVGGVLSAGPERLMAAAKKGVPQVVSVGALDMVNFGPKDTIPERFAHRKFHVHNPTVTLMRTTAEECSAIGSKMAAILRTAIAPTILMIPRGGVSALDAPGKPFFDPEADKALFEALEKGLAGAQNVQLIYRDEHINDPAFADAAARELFLMMRNFDPRLRELSRLTTSWAEPADFEAIAAFLASFHQPSDGSRKHLDDALIVRGPDGRILASAAMERHGSLGLLRSIAVAEEVRGLGIGSRLVSTLVTRAAAEGLAELALFTTLARRFFIKMGFHDATWDELAPRLVESRLRPIHPGIEVFTMRRSLEASLVPDAEGNPPEWLQPSDRSRGS